MSTNQKTKLRSNNDVRNTIKGLFDAKPANDPSYIIYHMIDENIPNNTTKDKILRITQFFNTLSFVESINNEIKNAYIEYNNLRYGFLTNGALFYGREVNGDIVVDSLRKYNIKDLTYLSEETYQGILKEINTQLNDVSHDIKEANTSKEKWYFWPGCEMKIPTNTEILLDTSVQKSKLVVTKSKHISENATQIVMEEKPYQLEVSLLGENEFFYKENEDAEELKLKPGFFSINRSKPEFENGTEKGFSEIDLILKEGEKYNFTLYVPYNSPSLDILTDMKIFGEGNEVEEFVATTT